MNYNVKTIDAFEKQAKRLIKKYASLKQELTKFINELGSNPEQGTPLGNGCYKIRLSIASKGKGKSGGARIITNIVIAQRTVYLLSIYDKSEKDSLTNKELENLLKDIPS